MQTIELIKKNNFHFKKKLGQNFLIDKNIIKKIINATNPKKDDYFLEIGTGLGSLTLELAKECHFIETYEIDSQLVNILLKEKLPSNIKIINKDFLKIKFNSKNNQKIIGNIPYYITHKILWKLLEKLDLFSQVTLMVQKDLVEKWTAPINSKKYSKSTVAINYFGGIKKLFDVNPKAFLPIPSIVSSVVQINIEKRLKIKKEKDFLIFIQKCFLARRKKLFWNLKQFVNLEKINFIYQKLNLSLNVRPQELGVKEFIEIWNHLI